MLVKVAIGQKDIPAIVLQAPKKKNQPQNVSSKNW